MTRNHESAFPDYPLPFTKKKMYLQTLPPEFWPHTDEHEYHEGTEFKTQVSSQYMARVQLAMGGLGLGTSTQTVISFGFFSWIFVDVDCPSRSPRLGGLPFRL